MSYHFVAPPFSISKEMTQTHARTHAAYHQLSTNDFFPGYRPSVKTLTPTERRFYMTFFLWDLPVVNGQHKLVCTMKYRA